MDIGGATLEEGVWGIAKGDMRTSANFLPRFLFFLSVARRFSSCSFALMYLWVLVTFISACSILSVAASKQVLSSNSSA